MSESPLDTRRREGLCSMCGEPLTEREKALEGVGGSYVRCDECVRKIQHGDGPEPHEDDFDWPVA